MLGAFTTLRFFLMKTKHFLESADVKAIAAAAEAEALKNHWPVTIAIVDDGGHLLSLNVWMVLRPFPRTSHPPKRTRLRWVVAQAKSTRT